MDDNDIEEIYVEQIFCELLRTEKLNVSEKTYYFQEKHFSDKSISRKIIVTLKWNFEGAEEHIIQWFPLSCEDAVIFGF